MASIIQNSQVFNNEVSFCRVYSIENKKLLEERFLAHRISYFIEWQDKSFFQRLFDRSGNKIVCTFRINRSDIAKARELCQGIEGIKFKDNGDLDNDNIIKRRSEAVKVKEDDGSDMEIPKIKVEEISGSDSE
ncbi:MULTISPECIES: hypothetical protein [unclassified Butyrivibrio]|uniref:hypothetical protein n=1 Tax=unclassified Butyrivibrio TaxID=2639466 RepID=UPI0008E361A9|nr:MULTISPECIES: hypothetical protein [unclassified Butyrivibrio]RKM58545.1 hypothetical protein D6856_12375 [Butyrivibrio sp. XB500-5]SFU59189.1 hypothetical protein SAMN02910342_01048 [Butyrivibrio sp. INlla21]